MEEQKLRMKPINWTAVKKKKKTNKNKLFIR